MLGSAIDYRFSFKARFINHWIFEPDCFTHVRQCGRLHWRPEGERWRNDHGLDAWHLAARRRRHREPARPLRAIPPSGDAAPPEEPKRPKRRWWRWGINIFAALLLVTLMWLIVTAPLSRALEPLDDPAMLLVSAEGRPIARRGAVKDEPVDAAKLDPMTSGRLHRHRGPALPQPLGHRSARDRPGDGGQCPGGRRSPGREHADPAAGQNQLSVLRPLAEAQGPGGDHRVLAGRLADQGRDSLALPVVGLFRRRRLRPARRLAPLFRPRAGAADPGPVGDAGRHGSGAVAPRPDPATSPPPRSAAGWCCRRWPTPATSPRREPRRPDRPGRSGDNSCVPTGTYFADWVAPQAAQAFDADYGEVKVPTTLDADLQRIAVRAIANARIGEAQAALVAMRPDGRVVAMVGGRNYGKSPFNRATQARRQPGSAFKLFVYLAALRAGYTPDSIVEDRPITVDGWSPRQQRQRLSRLDHPARGLRPVKQRGHGSAGRAGRPQQRHPRRPRPRHQLAADGPPEPGAGDFRESACSN